jgi:flavin-dependent dehydrogenase
VDVEALVTGKSARRGVPHVAGVAIRSGDTLRADLIVDATGRGSKSSKWLGAIDAMAPHEESEDCGFTYYTRYFRGTVPAPRTPPLVPFGTVSLLTLPADNDTWSVTFFAASDDKAVRASSCTNPSAGRGLTVGFKHGLLLRDALREAGDDPHALALRFDELTEERITPWYRAQIAWDRTRFATMRALADGREPPPPRDELAKGIGALLACMPADPDLFRAALEYIGTLTPVQEILRRPDVGAKIATAMQAIRESGAPALPGPNREQLLALVG